MIAFHVYGTPAPQGSKRAIKRKDGGVSLLESSRNVKPWRQEIADTARAHMHEHKLETIEEGPVAVSLVFSLRAPKSPKWKGREGLPDRKPDIDKLARAVLDALTGPCFRDDAQVCSLDVIKRYGDEMVKVDVYPLKERDPRRCGR